MTKKKETATETAELNAPLFDCLTVTNVQVFPLMDGVNYGHVKAYAQIVLNDQIAIRGLRVMESVNGLYVGYPVDPFFKGDEFRSVCFPITRQLREHIEIAVLEKYHNCKGTEND